MEDWYGVLAGMAYSAPYSIMSLIMGSITDRVDRILTLAVCISFAGISQIVTGCVNSFWVLFLMRILCGAMNSASSPLSFSIVADSVPPEKRGTANSFLTASSYVGIAVSSLSILMIRETGWRMSFTLMGLIGIILGVLALVIIKDPRDSNKTKEVEKTSTTEKEEEEPKLNSLKGLA
jgi:MFS family permease